MSYNLVIAEDEELQLNSLVRKVEKFCPDFTVVGTAQTGTQAYALVCELQPDVLITDIRMPVMDGIQLMEKVRSRFPDMAFIVTSGFSDFEYARSALRLQVSDYLLKPVEPEELEKALNELKLHLSPHREETVPIFSGEGDHRTPEQVSAEVMHYLRHHYVEEINLNQIAAKLHYSASYLTKIFYQQYETTPNKYVINLRMQKAQQLLLHNPELSVRQIGETVGYPEQGYFSRIFKKYVGVSPLEYRSGTPES
jgi:YesN/AraC family two-component response regulator